MLQAVAIFLFIMAILSGLITYISAHNNPLKIPDLTKPGSIATVVLFVASIITGLWSPVSIYGDCSDVGESRGPRGLLRWWSGARAASHVGFDNQTNSCSREKNQNFRGAKIKHGGQILANFDAKSRFSNFDFANL